MGLFGIIILTRFPQQHFSSYNYRILMILTIYLLVLSESRTAMLALIGSYIISITLNLATKRFVILSVIVGILALGLHVLLYLTFSNTLIAWYIMGIGFVLLVVSPFQKKSS